MSSKGKEVLKKRKQMLVSKVKAIRSESEYIIDRLQEIQLQAAGVISELEVETDERAFLQKYPTAVKKLEELQTQISRVSYELDVLACEESNITTSLSEERQTEMRQQVEVLGAKDVPLLTIPCPLQENDILDMRYISGDNPHDFWLRFYSTKELTEIRAGIQKLFEQNKLQPLKCPETDAIVCVCDTNDYFRGRIVHPCAGSSCMVLNVDSGSTVKVEIDKMFALTEDIAKIQAQALNCCLMGALGDPSLWDTLASQLFCRVMENSCLVVTIWSLPTDTCPKFSVKVDSHNELRAESMIDLSHWVRHTVMPALLEKKSSRSVDSLRRIFGQLSTKGEHESKKTSKENSKEVECSLKPQDICRIEEDSTNRSVENDLASNSIKEILNMSKPHAYGIDENVTNIGADDHASKCNQETQNRPKTHGHKTDEDSTNRSAEDHTSGSLKEKFKMPLRTGVSLRNLKALSVPHNDQYIPHSLPNHNSTPSMFVPLGSSQPYSMLTPQFLQFTHFTNGLPLVNQPQSFQFQGPSLTLPPLPNQPQSLQFSSPPPLPNQPQSLQFSSPPPLPNQSHCRESPPPPLLPKQPHSLQMSPPPLPKHPHSLQMSPPPLPKQPHSLQMSAPPLFPLQSLENMFPKQTTSNKMPSLGSQPKHVQSNVEEVQVRPSTSNDKQNEPSLLTNNGNHLNISQPSTTKLTLSIETAKSEVKPAETSIKKPGPSVQKLKPKLTNGTGGVSLKHHDFNFKIGARYNAFVAHINDPDVFYVHLACTDNAKMEALDEEMTKNYETCSIKFKYKEQAKKMLFESWCAAFYEDAGLWHRAKVTNWKDDTESMLEVQYVDYGMVCEVELSMIKPLKAEYTMLPMCATACRLAQIHPPQLQEDKSIQGIWPSETTELFKALVVMKDMYSIVVTSTSSNILSVLLVDNTNTIINQTLLEMEYAVAFQPIEFDLSTPAQFVEDENSTTLDEIIDSLTNLNVDDVPELEKDKTPKDAVKPAKSSQPESDQEVIPANWDPMAEDFYSVENTEYRDDENACYAVAGYVPKDEQRICQFFAKSGHCFKGVTCTKEHSMPNPDGWTTDKEAVLQEPLNSLELPPIGSMVTVRATSMCNLVRFFAHILWGGRGNHGEDESLSTLNEFMNSEENVRSMKRLRLTPAVGQLILAMYDNNFFRARVIDTNIEEHTVKVVYPDYANEEWVKEEDIREMELRYLHLPFQAVECFISNVKPITKSENALQEVSDMLLQKPLMGRIVSKNMFSHGGHIELELWDGNQKIADKLIEKGYAVAKKMPFFLAEDAAIVPM